MDMLKFNTYNITKDLIQILIGFMDAENADRHGHAEPIYHEDLSFQLQEINDKQEKITIDECFKRLHNIIKGELEKGRLIHAYICPDNAQIDLTYCDDEGTLEYAEKNPGLPIIYFWD